MTISLVALNDWNVVRFEVLKAVDMSIFVSGLQRRKNGDSKFLRNGDTYL
jgi:hypothetical protein